MNLNYFETSPSQWGTVSTYYKYEDGELKPEFLSKLWKKLDSDPTKNPINSLEMRLRDAKVRLDVWNNDITWCINTNSGISNWVVDVMDAVHVIPTKGKQSRPLSSACLRVPINTSLPVIECNFSALHASIQDGSLPHTMYSGDIYTLPLLLHSKDIFKTNAYMTAYERWHDYAWLAHSLYHKGYFSLPDYRPQDLYRNGNLCSYILLEVDFIRHLLAASTGSAKVIAAKYCEAKAAKYNIRKLSRRIWRNVTKLIAKLQLKGKTIGAFDAMLESLNWVPYAKPLSDVLPEDLSLDTLVEEVLGITLQELLTKDITMLSVYDNVTHLPYNFCSSFQYIPGTLIYEINRSYDTDLVDNYPRNNSDDDGGLLNKYLKLDKPIPGDSIFSHNEMSKVIHTYLQLHVLKAVCIATYLLAKNKDMKEFLNKHVAVRKAVWQHFFNLYLTVVKDLTEVNPQSHANVTFNYWLYLLYNELPDEVHPTVEDSVYNILAKLEVDLMCSKDFMIVLHQKSLYNQTNGLECTGIVDHINYGIEPDNPDEGQLDDVADVYANIRTRAPRVADYGPYHIIADYDGYQTNNIPISLLSSDRVAKLDSVSYKFINMSKTCFSKYLNLGGLIKNDTTDIVRNNRS